MVERLKWWWSYCSKYAFGKWFFSKILGFFIPYTGSITPMVREIRPGYAEVCIKDRHKNRNHLRSIHALAIANLGEVTTGLTIHFAMAKNQRAILTRLEVDYLKKARGTVCARAQINDTKIGEGLHVVQASILDDTNTQVATVSAHWLVDSKEKGQSVRS